MYILHKQITYLRLGNTHICLRLS